MCWRLVGCGQLLPLARLSACRPPPVVRRLLCAASKFHANSVEAAPHLLQRTCPSSAPYSHAAAVFEGFLVGDLRDVVREVREAGAVARLNPVQVGGCCCCNIFPPQPAAPAVAATSVLHCRLLRLLPAAACSCCTLSVASSELVVLDWATPKRRSPNACIVCLPLPLPLPLQSVTSVLWLVLLPVLSLFILRQFVLAAVLDVSGREMGGMALAGCAPNGGTFSFGWEPARQAAGLVQAPT